MEALDWLVIGVFFLALIGIIVWVVRQKQNDSADYFLGGRDATWLAIGASIFASNIGSEHLIGLAGAGASSGMAMAHWEIQGWMILILVLLVGCASYFSGVRLYYVQSGSMEPELPVGSLCIVTPCVVEELEVGDIIAFQNGPMQVAHRIVSIQEESYQTQGFPCSAI